VFNKFKDIFKKNWQSCPYDLFVVSDLKMSNPEPFIPIIDSGDWMARLNTALENIKSDFVLLLLDDYFIGRNANFLGLENIISRLQNEDINCVRLINIPVIKRQHAKCINNNILKIYADHPYVLNLQVTIWKKNKLKEIINKGDGSAWDFEVHTLKNFSKECNFGEEKFYFCSENLLDIKNAVIKGAWVPDIDTYLQNEGIDAVSTERKKMTHFMWIKYRLKSYLSVICPLAIRRPIKSILKIFGFKFYSEL
jgi:hypothetical protein